MSTIDDLYYQARQTRSDIHEHLERMRQLGEGCQHITELGVRTGVSTIAWAAARPKSLVCYDIRRYAEVDPVESAAKAAGVEFMFYELDVLSVTIEPTDLLFIDTLHTYDQLRAELDRHASRARKYVVLHDTTTFGETGELPGTRGLWPAVEEFLAAHPEWTVSERRSNNNGLTILKRKDKTRVCVMTAVFGDYDNLWPLPVQDIDCETLLISDRPYNIAGWKNKTVSTHTTARMAAKEPRCVPHRWTDADIVIWLDASLEVRSNSLVRELVTQLGNGKLGAFRHDFHASISQETQLAATLPKYGGYDLRAQARHYLHEGHPDDWGLWTTGIMVRRPAETVEFGEAWLKEIERWGPEDQVSLPYVLRRTIGYPVDLPFEGWWQGTRFMLHCHNDGT